MLRPLTFRVLLIAATISGTAFCQTVDFEDWELAPEADWVGPVEEGREQSGVFGGTERIGHWFSNGIGFENRHNLDFGSWTGFAVSNRTDTTTPGFMNDTSAFAVPTDGENYAIGFGYLPTIEDVDQELLESLPHFDVPAGHSIASLDVVNATYTALSILEGDDFAKKFGGVSGDDPDFFRLTVHGENATGQLMSESVEFYLADYRGANNTVVDEWTTLDLTPLQDAQRVYFNLASSDIGAFGMATPGYFALDNIQLRASMDLEFDFDENGTPLTTQDADLLCTAIAGAGGNMSFDLNADGQLTVGDMAVFLEAAESTSGDSNLDGSVDFEDFLSLSSNFGNDGTWSEGDSTCDGSVQFLDFLNISQNFTMAGATASASHAVPEPESPSTILGALLLLSLFGLRHSRS